MRFVLIITLGPTVKICRQCNYFRSSGFFWCLFFLLFFFFLFFIAPVLSRGPVLYLYCFVLLYYEAFDIASYIVPCSQFLSVLFSIVITLLGEERVSMLFVHYFPSFFFIWARSCENVSYASAQSDQHLCCSLLR